MNTERYSSFRQFQFYQVQLVCALYPSEQEEEAQPLPEASEPLSEGRSSLMLVPSTQCHLLAEKANKNELDLPKQPHPWTFKKDWAKPYLVIYITVCEHCVEVLHTLACTPVVHALKSFLDGAHVHWALYDLVIVLDTKKKQKVFQHHINVKINKDQLIDKLSCLRENRA